jgi:hypothetical protein
MVQCWAMESSDRPFFADIVKCLTPLIENSSESANYITLDEVTGGEYIQTVYTCHNFIIQSCCLG